VGALVIDPGIVRRASLAGGGQPVTPDWPPPAFDLEKDLRTGVGLYLSPGDDVAEQIRAILAGRHAMVRDVPPWAMTSRRASGISGAAPVRSSCD